MRDRYQYLGRRFSKRKQAGGLGVLAVLLVMSAVSMRSQTPFRQILSAPFTRQVMKAVGPESPLDLRQFIGPVKTDSRGRVITGPNSDPVKNIVGAESAGIR